ncbi:MAG: flagellar basal body rod protein [Deltaproteobacteria bacterium]|nr:flagellar basal body rod protein [Deltaproteobacteria bacterium]
MGSIFDVARSGLAASALRLSTSAHNLANALTPGFTPLAVDAAERPGGGVEARAVPGNDPRLEARLDAAALGYGAGSGTDLATELVSQMAASAAYRANLTSLRTADDLTAALLSVRG